MDILRIKSFIDLNISKIKRGHVVAEMLHLSYNTLRKTFLRVERVPLADYIAAKKLAAMKEHLLIAQDHCYSICYEYGFREDAGAKMFKRETGMTMQEFRLLNGTVDSIR